MPVSVSGTTSTVTVTASASTHTKGAFTTLIASTSFAADAVQLVIAAMNDGADRRYVFDLAIGGAGSEVVIVPDLFVATTSNGPLVTRAMLLPMAIPAGSRLSARTQCNVGSNSLFLSAQIIAGDAATVFTLGSAAAASYGQTLASTRGTTIDPGASAGTKGAYVEITPATSSGQDARWMLVHLNQVNNILPASADVRIDIATGGSGSETIIWPDLPASTRVNAPGIWPAQYFLPVAIPSGTRIAIRAQSSITDATDRVFDVVVTLFEGSLAAGSGGAGLGWAPLSVVGAALGGGLSRMIASGAGWRG